MNRGHTADDYRRLVDRLRAARPDLALSSDFIAGHPGETEADYRGDARADPRHRLRPGVFLQVFAAPWHAGLDHGGTGAEEVKDARLAEIQALLRDQQAAFNRSRAGCWPRCWSPAQAAIPARWPGARPG